MNAESPMLGLSQRGNRGTNAGVRGAYTRPAYRRQ